MTIAWYLILLVVIAAPLVCALAFANWVRLQSGLKFEEKAKAWEIFVSLTSAMTAIVGGVLLVGKYLDGQASQARNDLDFKHAEALRVQVASLQQKHDRKRRGYDNAKKIALELAGLDGNAFEEIRNGKKRQDFELLYWADLIGVENQKVESAMVNMRQRLNEWVINRKKPEEGDDQTNVHQAALTLSSACEEDVRKIETEIDTLNEQIAAISSRARTQ